VRGGGKSEREKARIHFNIFSRLPKEPARGKLKKEKNEEWIVLWEETTSFARTTPWGTIWAKSETVVAGKDTES